MSIMKRIVEEDMFGFHGREVNVRSKYKRFLSLDKKGKEMKTTDKDRIDALRDVIRECITFVGASNYTERELHAKKVANQAISAYLADDMPEWQDFEDEED